MLRRLFITVFLRRRNAGSNPAKQLLGGEDSGLAIDFLTNTYAIKTES